MKYLKTLTLLAIFSMTPFNVFASKANEGCYLKDYVSISGSKSMEDFARKLVRFLLPPSQLELKPFFTDGCTMFIDGPTDRPKLWRNCCVEHDLRYWFGGSEQEMDQTDLRLKSCVEKVAGAKWAKLIYIGVRTGHHSPIKNKTQWNWGWVQKRDYSPLNPEEITQVKNKLEEMDVPGVDMQEFLRVNFP